MNNDYIWTGHVIIIPGQHSLIIVGPWSKDKKSWWWKCGDCKESSGCISSIELQRLDIKGMISLPEPNAKLPIEYSGHPQEYDVNDYNPYIYDMWD